MKRSLDLALCSLLLTAAFARAEETGVDFFEKKIRPVLAESCYECHGEKKQKGGLRLDSKAGWEKGGDTGPAIVPGQPEKSLLLQAVRYQDHDLKMPPEKSGGKMPDDKIAELESWIKIGAPDPRVTGPSLPAHDMGKAQTHWSFKPVVKPAVPGPAGDPRVKTPVDAFVLAQLDAKGIKPAPPADRRTLLRRVYFDLIGIPPTPAQAQAFENDPSPEAFAKVVDELLASPHYGERWGRYWLDVARYADTRGYLAGGEERRFPFSYTYRDYVVSAFNEDKPYDRFICEQLAADKLVAGDDRRPLAALGFLTLGRSGTFQDTIDDRIDVTTRGLMALTVACARCHDHKFDPIPTADYYSLSGVFESSEEPAEKPLLTTASNDGPAYRDFLKKQAELQAKVDAKKETIIQAFRDAERQKLGDYLLGARDAKALPDPSKLETFAGERKLSLPLLQRWIACLSDPARAKDPSLAPWMAYAALPEADFTAVAQNVPLAPPLIKSAPASLKEVVAAYNEAGKASLEMVRPLLQGDSSPLDLPRAELEKVLARPLADDTAELRRNVAALQWTHPGAPMRAMALVDRPNLTTPHILLRGNPGNPGVEVPRQFLELLAGPGRQPFKEGSGRLELAKAIASRDNPLTARVFVNRLWGWHFGQPLVRTPGDFGVRTEAPAELDLLNWMAATFMEEGWSMKKLHRQILLSATYQQASDGDPESDTADPDNSLLHRYLRHRLDFESMRDTLLADAGRLDLTMGGQPVEIVTEPFSTRRTLYGFIDRLNLPGLFHTFDFANPDISSPQRFSTTVPQQALFMMNSPFVVEQARALVHRPEIERSTSDGERLQALYTLLYQRPPDAGELSDATAYLERERSRAAHPPTEGGWQYGFGNYDAAENRTKDFQVFAFVDKARRSPAAKLPDPELAYLQLLPNGGHPGSKYATVIRWTAPADGEVNLAGTITHLSDKGDGVRARIVSSTAGKIGEWPARNGKAETSVEKLGVKTGETIDFLVDCQGDDSYDSYTWVPRVSYLDAGNLKVSKASWDSETDFRGGPQLTALSEWETLAQALLVSNESMFIE